MSSFELALPTVLLHEGLCCNDPKDSGGMTHYGISLRFLKSLDAQEGDLNGDGKIDAEDIQSLNLEQATQLYRTEFWEHYNYSAIENQLLATKVFDLSVNLGPYPAHRSLQRAVRAVSSQPLREDGVLGPLTLMTANALNPTVLLAALRSEAAGYYRSLHRPRFEQGWLNRAYA